MSFFNLFFIISKTILSNAVFVLAVILYSTVGAFVFQLLEEHAELAQCEGVYIIDKKSQRL